MPSIEQLPLDLDPTKYRTKLIVATETLHNDIDAYRDSDDYDKHWQRALILARLQALARYFPLVIDTITSIRAKIDDYSETSDDYLDVTHCSFKEVTPAIEKAYHRFGRSFVQRHYELADTYFETLFELLCTGMTFNIATAKLEKQMKLRHTKRIDRPVPLTKNPIQSPASIALQLYEEFSKSATRKESSQPLVPYTACDTTTRRTPESKIVCFEMTRIDDHYPDEWNGISCS